jgi:hypothetical protein
MQIGPCVPREEIGAQPEYPVLSDIRQLREFSSVFQFAVFNLQFAIWF